MGEEVVKVDVHIRVPLYEYVRSKAKAFKLTPQGLMAQIVETWVADCRGKDRIAEFKKRKQTCEEDVVESNEEEDDE